MPPICHLCPHGIISEMTGPFDTDEPRLRCILPSSSNSKLDNTSSTSSSRSVSMFGGALDFLPADECFDEVSEGPENDEGGS
ncbi:hypothetical protein KC360_g70 [Hortaea werneckii]|nr:hypothetical protein KC360_g70 [Hortaea werneckii]